MKILFIHGYQGGAFGSTATELKRQLGERAQVFAPAFSNDIQQFENILANIQEAQRLVDEEQIDLVIGSSMGAFATLYLREVARMVINPCMKPSEQFGTLYLSDTSVRDIRLYQAWEEQLNPTREERERTWAFFAEADELFSYREHFCKLFDADKAFTTKGSHRNSPQRIEEDIIPLIERIFAL